MYVAVKGGEAAIAASLRLLEEARRGDPAVRELEVTQIREQLGLLVDRVMAEGSLYDPVDTDRMQVQRRVSAIFKDLPGGQLLGATFDYTQRLLDFGLLEGGGGLHQEESSQPVEPSGAPPAMQRLMEEGLVEPAVPGEGDPEPADITREPPAYPMDRAARC